MSQNLIIFGTEKTTGALFIYKKSPYVFHKAIPGSIIKGPITCIKISHDEQTIAFSNDSGQVGFVTLKNNTFSKSSSVQLPDNASATCFCWHFDDKQVYVGDTGGSVSVINLNFFIVSIKSLDAVVAHLLILFFSGTKSHECYFKSNTYS